MLESFLRFARELPAEKLDEVEDALAAIMASFNQGDAFTPVEMAELNRRLQVSDPEYASDDAVRAIFGKSFSE